MNAEQEHHELITALAGVSEVADLEALIARIVDALEGPLQLWHASLAVLIPEQGVVRLLAAWSRTDSAFEAGTEVAITISPKIEQAVEILRSGDAVIVEMGRTNGSLVDHLMQQQGVAAALGIPIASRTSLWVLTLGSSDGPSIRQLGQAFCRELADQLQGPITHITSSRTSSGPS